MRQFNVSNLHTLKDRARVTAFGARQGVVCHSKDSTSFAAMIGCNVQVGMGRQRLHAFPVATGFRLRQGRRVLRMKDRRRGDEDATKCFDCAVSYMSEARRKVHHFFSPLFSICGAWHRFEPMQNVPRINSALEIGVCETGTNNAARPKSHRTSMRGTTERC
jgi:hypothetical protein